MSAASDPLAGVIQRAALLLTRENAERIACAGGEVLLTGDELDAWCLELCALGDFAVATYRIGPPIRAKERDRWARAFHALRIAEDAAAWCEHGPPALPPEWRSLALAWIAAPRPQTRQARSYPLRITARLAELYRWGFGRWPSAQETGRPLRFLCAFHAELAALPIMPRYVAPTLDAERYRLRQVLSQWRNLLPQDRASAQAAPGAGA